MSTFYYKPKPDNHDDEIIIKEIEKIIEILPESGYRPVTEILKRDRIINHKKVHRIMFFNGLLCRKTMRFQAGTTDSRHKYLKYPNIAKNIIIATGTTPPIFDCPRNSNCPVMDWGLPPPTIKAIPRKT